MYKLEFELKQHTPIIHFQHDQDGATLRATEVKPKLDKFIKTISEDEGIDHSHWFMPNVDNEALDYKVRITAETDVKYYLPLSLRLSNNKTDILIDHIQRNLNMDVELIAPSPFFSNSDKIKFKYNKSDESYEIDEKNTNISKLEFAIHSDKPISITLLSRHKDLIKKIEDNLYLFFLLNNFGKRQNKGFGSFFPVDKTFSFSQSESAILNKFPEILGIYSKYEKNNTFNEFFKDIDSMWKVLKAGKNYNGYEKSDLFQYFYNETPKVRWEKRAIKKGMKAKYRTVFDNLKYESGINRILTESDSGNNHYFIRALLGLPEYHEYGKTGYGNKAIVKIADTLSRPGGSKEKAIQRFKAPITFKLIDNIVYMIVFGVPASLHTLEGESSGRHLRKFDFTLDEKVNNSPHHGLLDTLSIPDNFNILNFLNSPKMDKNGTPTGKTIAQSYKFEQKYP